MLLCATAFLAGCGSGGTLSGPAPIVYPNISGNWQIQTNAGSPNLGVLLVGVLNETNSAVTGTLQFTNLVPGNACGSNPYIVSVSGNVSDDGVLTLKTDPSTGGPAISASLQLAQGANAYAYGTASVSSPSPCAVASTSVLGAHIGDLSGKYMGMPALTGAILGVGVSSATLTLTQATTANADGSFPVTGNLSFGGAACSAATPVQGSILGVSLMLASPLAAGSSQPEVTIEAASRADRSQLYSASIDFHSGQCTANTSGFADYQGALTRVN